MALNRPEQSDCEAGGRPHEAISLSVDPGIESESDGLWKGARSRARRSRCVHASTPRLEIYCSRLSVVPAISADRRRSDTHGINEGIGT